MNIKVKGTLQIFAYFNVFCGASWISICVIKKATRDGFTINNH